VYDGRSVLITLSEDNLLLTVRTLGRNANNVSISGKEMGKQ